MEQIEKSANVTRIQRKKQKQTSSRTLQKATQLILQRSWTCAISQIPNWTRNSEVHRARRITWWCSAGWFRTLLFQGSSASHMTGAKGRDVISRLPDCAGKASDAVFSIHSVKNGRWSQTVLRLPKGECPVIWVHANSDLDAQKSSDKTTDPVVPLGRNLYGHPSPGLLWERTFAEVLFEEGWEKREPGWNAYIYICIEQVTFFLEIYVDVVTMATHAEKADEQSRSWRTNSNCRPTILGMSAVRKRNNKKSWWRSRTYSTSWYHPV